MTRISRLFLIPGTLAALSGCGEYPELNDTVTPQLEASSYPDLVPLGPVLAQASTQGTDPVQAQASAEARVAALRARAARLRGSVLSGAERVRLAEGLR